MKWGHLWMKVLLCFAFIRDVAALEPKGGGEVIVPSSVSDLTKYRAIKNRKELLTAVNSALLQRKHPPFSTAEFIACVGEQAHCHWREEDLSPKIQSFLKRLVSGRNFEDPVELWANYSNCIPLSGSYPSYKLLFVPMHYTLEIHVLWSPRGSKDRDGKAMKLDWGTIAIAHGLAE